MLDGKMELVRDLGRTWSYFLVICLDGVHQLNTCWLIVCISRKFFYSLYYAFVIGREDFLTEAVRYWNQRKIDSLPQMLIQRLRKVILSKHP